MKKLYELARGTVRIAVKGVEPEKALNACVESDIGFSDARPQDEFSVLITVKSSDLPNVRTIARKSSCDIQIIKTRGGKMLGKAAKRRSALILGLALCVVAVAVSSLFVWKIDVSGNEKLTYGEIVRALEESGIGYGSFWPSKSADEIRNEILLNHPEISWMSVNMSSSSLEVDIHEREERPEIINEAEPCDIRAEKNGIVTNISVLEGESLIHEGDTVCRGDCLISGTVQSETAEPRKVHALGEVEARTWYEISAVTPLTESIKTEKDGKSNKISVLLGKKRINFYADSRNNEASCDKINKIGYLSAWNTFVFPLGIARQSSLAFTQKETTVDKAAATERMHADLLEELRGRIGDGEIVSVSFATSESGGLLTVTLRAECLENIADIKE